MHMKKRIRLSSSITLFLLGALALPVFSHAADRDEEVRKKKTLNKSYSVSAEDKLEIENQFGNVTISVWDKNEITVDVEMAARASSEQKAQDIMDEIDVKEFRSGHIISFKTKVGEIRNGDKKNKGGGDEERIFYIDYVVHMPSANRLQLENSFGKIVLPDINGEVNLTSKFGSLTTGKLGNVDAIDVEFGRANIGEIKDGKIVFKFNKESNIAKINGNVKITSEFSHNVQFKVGEDIQDLSVLESYSGVRMIVTKTLSAQFDVHTSFGKFRNESDFTIREKHEDDNDYGPHFDKDYSGKAGEGKARIRIKSSFGDVRLSHNAATAKDNVSKEKEKNNNNNKDKDDDDDDDDDNDKEEKTT
jgi:hypothetical protein